MNYELKSSPQRFALRRAVITLPAVPLKLRIAPPLMDPIRSAALTRLVREGSTRFLLSSFRLGSDSIQALPAARTVRRVSESRYLKHSPSRPLTGVYAFPPCLSTVFHCFLFVSRNPASVPGSGLPFGPSGAYSLFFRKYLLSFGSSFSRMNSTSYPSFR